MNSKEESVINNAYNTSKNVLKLLERIENNEFKVELPTKIKKEKWYEKLFSFLRNMLKK